MGPCGAAGVGGGGGRENAFGYEVKQRLQGEWGHLGEWKWGGGGVGLYV